MTSMRLSPWNAGAATAAWAADRRFAARRRGEIDRGLPTWTRQPGEWARANIASSWGKYRHTVSGAIPDDGGDVAVFQAELPTPGRWQLDYHVPNRNAMAADIDIQSYGTLGSLHMTLAWDGNETSIVFDGADADVGWNRVGEFDLQSTAVRLEVASRSDGEIVIADAIRWVPLERQWRGLSDRAGDATGLSAQSNRLSSR